MNLAVLGGIAAPLLVFLAAIAGYLFKQHNDKRQREAEAAEKEAARKAKTEQEKADREAAAKAAADALAAQQAQEAYDAMQEDLRDARTEVRALRTDLDKARTDMAQQQEEALRLWTRFSAMSRAFDAAEAHIAEVHRWDDNGRTGPMPRRPIGEV